jgi:hypothetical protein
VNQYGHLSDETLYLFRHAGVSSWLAWGMDSSWAARQAGHNEANQITYYKGVIDHARGQRRLWTDTDTFVEQALSDSPPRGDGELATRIRAWLCSGPST